MTSPWTLILPLAAGTFSIRIGGALLARRIPTHGPWARATRALPGCLIVSLVAMSLVAGDYRGWIAGLAAALVALVALATRSLPLAMAAGIAAIWALRHYT